MSRTRASGYLMHVGREVVFFAGMFLLMCCLRAESAPNAVQPVDCGRWIDSMIVVGKRTLEKGAVDSARQFFTAAYHCGMSRDSMLYFASEIYIQSGAPDSAMTFNMALERGGRFDRRFCLEQRVRIYRSIGMNHRADSIAERLSLWGRHELHVDGSATRSVLSISGLTLMPQLMTLRFPNDDTDDVGRAGLYYKWSKWSVDVLPKLILTLNLFSDQKVPTRYSYDEMNDTLMRSVAVGIGVGEYPHTPEGSVSYRARVHDLNGDVDHYLKAMVLVARRTALFTAQHETKLTDRGAIDDSRTDVSFLPPPVGHRVQCVFGLSGGYHFTKSDFYQSLLDTAVFLTTMRVGYVDSLKPDATFRYFTDQSLAHLWRNTDMIGRYWDGQPKMHLVAPLPEHNLNASLRTTLRAQLPFGLSVRTTLLAQLIGYIGTVEWYAFDKQEMLNVLKMNQYSVIYFSDVQSYYLQTNNTQTSYHEETFRKLTHHRRKRVDAFVLVSPVLEKKCKRLGMFYVSTSYLKGFSTLDDTGPVARLNDLWQFTAGWSKEMVLGKK